MSSRLALPSPCGGPPLPAWPITLVEHWDSQSLRPRVSTATVLGEPDPLAELGVSICQAWVPRYTMRGPTVLARRTCQAQEGPRSQSSG